MFADLLYYLYPYQIFKSVFFRSGMAYLTTYILINLVMPRMIRLFRRKGITSDFSAPGDLSGPYTGATPIMGGLVLIPSILLSILLWVWINQYTLAVLIIMTGFSIIGALDDGAKVLHKRRIEAGKEQKKEYADKADGISGRLRLSLEFLLTTIVVVGLYTWGSGVDIHMHIPMIPMKTWFPEVHLYLFIPLVILMIVGGANAVNLTDGLDSLASVPVITCAIFVAAAAYISGDPEWTDRLKLLYISDEVKELTVFAIALIAACSAFLKFNSPPASIYMGDLGSLGLGGALCTMFLLVKAELYLPIVGGTFVVAALSTILQRFWFKVALKRKGRAWAEKHRFFYRAPYHHHKQELITYREEEHHIFSIWHQLLRKIGVGNISDEDKYLTREQVNNKVIWDHHLKAIFYLVIALIIYFKVR